MNKKKTNKHSNKKVIKKKFNKTKSIKTKSKNTKSVKNTNKKIKKKSTKSKKSKNTKKIKKRENYYCKIGKFENGMTYFIKNDNSYNNVSLMFKVKCGGVTEGKYEGLSHLLEHILFNGTKTYPTRELLSKELSKYGTITNGSTTEEETAYYMTIYPSKLDKIIPILSEMIRFSNIDSYILEKEKNILENEKNYRTDMNSYLNRLNKLELFKNSIYKNSYGGDKTTLKDVEKHHILAYLHTFYQPRNCIIGILGNFNISKNDIIKLLKTNFDHADLIDYYKLEKTHKKYKDYLKEELYFKKILNTIDKKRKLPINYNWNIRTYKMNHLKQAYIFISFECAASLVKSKIIEKKRKLDNFIKTYLTYSRVGKLDNILRNQEKLIYNININSYRLLAHNGLFIIKYNIIPEPNSINKSINLVLETLNNLKTEFLTEKDIKYFQQGKKMNSKTLEDDTIDELDLISSELVLANLNSPYYKERIKDIQDLNKKSKKSNKELITPKNIQKRAIEMFNKNKMSIICFTPNNIKLSINDFKNKL